jgi:Family of unknown function (DUF6496)
MAEGPGLDRGSEIAGFHAACVQKQSSGLWLGIRVNKEATMPEKETLERAEQDAREGKSPGTQAGEFVREEIQHIREGKHGAASPKQAIAIGLSKARRAGVDLPLPKKGSVSEKTLKSAERDSRRGRSGRKKTASASRSRSSLTALKREPRSAASHKALSRQAKSAARTRKKAGTTTQSSRTPARRKAA